MHWVGCKGWLGRLKGSDVNVFRQTYDPATNQLWPRRSRDLRNFLDSLTSGQPPMYTAEALHRLSTTLHLGAIDMELGRPLRWDSAAKQLPGDAAANALRMCSQRHDWRNA